MTILTREEIEAREDRDLAPYAMRSRDTRGRDYSEPEHSLRTAFQRDRDRIIHCTAFRRLEYKTQVFVNHEGDHYRTRLTHTLEVAQLARTIARSLGLNEDLAETIALAHDIGHTPFGHSGEDALNKIIKELNDKDKSVFGFEHNRQGLRIVTVLEHRYPEFCGLNLTYEVREGIIKHSSRHDHPVTNDMEKKYDLARRPLLEAQIVDVADAIAYNNHDLDDGIHSGLLNLEILAEVKLWRESEDFVKNHYSKKLTQGEFIKMIIKHLIDLQATDVINHTAKQIRKSKVASTDDVRNYPDRLISFSSGLAKKVAELEKFLYENLYKNYRVARMAIKAQRFIRELFFAYYDNEQNMPPEYRERALKEGKIRVICDYIAGMTDRYAQEEYIKLFQPFERV